VRLGGAVLQTHKLADNDRDHAAALLEHFDPPMRAHVLDAGSGVGAVASLMTELRPDLRFSLLNISAAQLELAPGSMVKIHGDFQRMPVADAAFDAVMFNYSLGHGLLDACIGEAARVLRPGGVLFIYDLTTDDQAHVIPLVGYRPHGRAEVEASAIRHGFTICRVVENPPTSTADYLRLFGCGVMERHGLDRTWPIIYRFRLHNSGPVALDCAAAAEAVQLTGLTWDGRPMVERDKDGCFAHCLSFLLSVPSADVPNFHQEAGPEADQGKAVVLARAWLAERGMTLLALPSSAAMPFLFANLETLNPGVPFILVGASRTVPVLGHAVVYRAGQVLCDPGGHGISGPSSDDGNFWIFYLTALVRLPEKPRERSAKLRGPASPDVGRHSLPLVDDHRAAGASEL